jgi:erythronate-4-phosphate dehydrogenase
MVAERLGMRVLVCDPLLGNPDFVPLSVIEQDADIITFHVPLTRQGTYATWHLADDSFLHRLRKAPYLMNTSRGEVVDNTALLKAIQEGRVRDAVIDVWEGEPLLNEDLLQHVFIGTPHIAGYSADGKANADNMVIDALCRHFGLPLPDRVRPPKLPADFHYTGNPLELYNPMRDSEALKNNPSGFEELRNNYPLRREYFDV